MGRPALTLEFAQECASRKGGVCLSSKYVQIHTKMRWRCAQGHEWETNLACIKGGRWCPTCKGIEAGNRNRNPRGLAEAKALAVRHNIECLSEEYKDAHYPLRWRCPAGHEWTQKLNAMRYKQMGCSKCSGTVVDSNERLAKARQVAEEQGGICLSDAYTRAHDMMRWRCGEGHEWSTQFHHVVGPARSWCPNCSKFRREDECRAAFETVTGVRFHKYRAGWLGRLELDGFNEELSIAFEYQGEQHYRFCSIFHRTEEDLRKQQDRDKLKADLCAQRGIELVCVPYTTKNLAAFARSEYERITRKRTRLSDEDVEQLLADLLC